MRFSAAPQLTLGLALFCSGCEDPVCEPLPAETSLSEREQRHACLHAVDGPFGELGSEGEVENLHMHYDVTLDREGRARLTFPARRSTTHVVYLSHDEPLAVFDAETGEQLCAVRVEAEHCDALEVGTLFDLEDGQVVRLEIGPSERAEVSLVAERMR